MEPEVMEKRCKYCGCNRVIARRIRGDTDKHALAVFCSVQYCPEHRKIVRDITELARKRESRKDCRISNRQLKREILASEQNRELLEEANQQLREQNMVQAQLIEQLRRDLKAANADGTSRGEGGILPALRTLCGRRKPNIEPEGQTVKEGLAWT